VIIIFCEGNNPRLSAFRRETNEGSKIIPLVCKVSMTSTVSVWPARVAVQFSVWMSKMRMAGELVASAKWVGASGGPISRTSVISSLLPISCLVSESLPSFLPCGQERHPSDTFYVKIPVTRRLFQRKVCWRLLGDLSAAHLPAHHCCLSAALLAQACPYSSPHAVTA